MLPMVQCTSSQLRPSSQVEVHSLPDETEVGQNQTQLSTPPLLSSVDEIKAFIHQSRDEEKPVFASFHVADHDLETIYEFVQVRGFRNFRISCSNTHNLTVRYLPGVAHHVAVRELESVILSSICESPHLPRNFCRIDAIVLTGAATVTLDKRDKLYKESDGSFSSSDTFPLVVIEAGVPQFMPQMEDDARHWLQETSVNMVILITLGPEASGPDADGVPMPCIQVQHFEKLTPDVDDQGRTPRIYTTLSAVWTHEDDVGDFMLPGRHFFVEGTAEHQVFRAGDYPIVVKREKILKIRRWIREMWRS